MLAIAIATESTSRAPFFPGLLRTIPAKRQTSNVEGERHA